jgi:tRNA (cytidine/uridine-2'-O-)-methyltransferase
MDYAAAAEVTYHADWAAFRACVAERRIVLLTTRGGARLPDARFATDDILLFGSESAGAPPFVHAAALAVRIPMQPGFRSLNIAVAAGIALGEALRQTEGFAA